MPSPTPKCLPGGLLGAVAMGWLFPLGGPNQVPGGALPSLWGELDCWPWPRRSYACGESGRDYPPTMVPPESCAAWSEGRGARGNLPSSGDVESNPGPPYAWEATEDPFPTLGSPIADQPPDLLRLRRQMAVRYRPNHRLARLVEHGLARVASLEEAQALRARYSAAVASGFPVPSGRQPGPPRPPPCPRDSIPPPRVATFNCRSLNLDTAAALIAWVAEHDVDLLACQETWWADDCPRSTEVQAALRLAGFSLSYWCRPRGKGAKGKNSRAGGVALVARAPWTLTLASSERPEACKLEVTAALLHPPGRADLALRVVSAYLPPELKEEFRRPEDMAAALKVDGVAPQLVGADLNTKDDGWVLQQGLRDSAKTLHNDPKGIRKVEQMLRLTPAMPHEATHVRGNVLDLFLHGQGIAPSTPQVRPIPLDALGGTLSDHHPVCSTLGVGSVQWCSSRPSRDRAVIRWRNLSRQQISVFGDNVAAGLEGPPGPTAMEEESRIRVAVRRAMDSLPRVRLPGRSRNPARGWGDPQRELIKELQGKTATQIWKAFAPPVAAPSQPAGLRDSLLALSQASPLPPAAPPADPVLDIPLVHHGEVKAAIRKQAGKGSADPHGICPEILSMLPPVATEALAQLFDMVNKGDIPPAWMRAEVVPIPKPGKDHTILGGWRPISLTSLFCRLWERTVLLRVESSLNLSEAQYGFRRGRSATMLTSRLRTALRRALSITEYGHPPRKGHAVLLSLDATAAFTSVPISALQDRVRLLGVPEAPGILAWLGHQGSPRLQKVRGTPGSWVHCTSGFPQGSVLGPLLWALYIDPILRKASEWKPSLAGMGKPVPHTSGACGFADDTQLFASGTHIKEFGAFLGDQATTMVEQLEKDGIKLSGKSTAQLMFRGLTGNRLKAHGEYKVKAGDHSIQVTSETTSVLGVDFDSRMAGQDHKSRIAKGIRRGFTVLEAVSRLTTPSIVRQLYLTYVWPHVTYAATTRFNLGWNDPVLTAGSLPGRPTRQPGTYTHHQSVAGRSLYVPEDCKGDLVLTTLEYVEKLHNAAARLISGTVKGSETALVLREASLLPAGLMLDKLATREDERVARLSHASPGVNLVGLALPRGSNQHFAIAPVPGDREPMLEKLPYSPPWAAGQADRISFSLLSHKSKGVCPLSELYRDNVRRIEKATALLSPQGLCIMASDGSVKTVGDRYSWTAAGAACLRKANAETEKTARNAGTGACSYTAERAGVLCALRLLEESDVFGDILWICDSKSLLQALNKGPLGQTGYQEAQIWLRLLTLVESRGMKISFVWIFSHANPGVGQVFAPAKLHDEADALAETAVDVLEGEEPLNPDSRWVKDLRDTDPPPLWWVDAARLRYSIDRDAYLGPLPEVGSEPEIRTRRPLNLAKVAAVGAPKNRLLSCLRAGVWGPLGFEHEHARQCSWCGQQVPQRSGGICHMLSCPGAAAIRTDTFTEQTLWSMNVNIQRKLADYAIAFREGPTPSAPSRP